MKRLDARIIALSVAAVLVGALLRAVPAGAVTTVLGPHRYGFSEGVDFLIDNDGQSHFLFVWSDGGNNYVNVANPTLVLSAGQTYTFRRVGTKHPFVITDSTLPITGTDGAYERLTTDPAVIDSTILKPQEDFTADPAPTTDMITWHLDAADAGTYAYTCSIPAHVYMTGRIYVTTGQVAADPVSWSAVKATYR